MKIELNKDMLEKKLGISCSLIGKSTTLPILNENLFKFKDDRMIICSSTLDIESEAGMPFELLEGEVADFVAEGSTILQTLKHLKSETFTMELVAEKKTQKLVFGTPKTRKTYEIPITYEASSFPADASEFSDPTILEGGFVADAIKTCGPVVNPSNLIPHFQGMFIGKVKDKIRIVGASNERMIIFEKDTDVDFKEIVVPKSVLSVIQNFASSVDLKISVSKDGRKVKFTDEALTVYARVIDCKYPNIDQVIDAFRVDDKVVINRQDFYLSINRSKIFANQEIGSVDLNFAGEEIEISSQNINFRKKASESIPYVSKSDTINWLTRFNGNILIEAISPLDGENINFCQKSFNSGAVITDDKNRGYSITSILTPQLVSQPA